MASKYINVFSPSKISIFESCPRKYYLKYLDPEISPRSFEIEKATPILVKGGAIHNAITLFLHNIAENTLFSPTLQNLKEQLKLAWWTEKDKLKKPPLGESGGFSSIEQERFVYQEALTQLETFHKLYQTHLQNVKFTFLPAKNFKNSFNDYKKSISKVTDTASIGGKLDLALEEDRGVHVIDFKTGKEQKNDFQLRFYKLLVENWMQKPVTKASYYYLKTGNVNQINTSNLDSGKIKEEVVGKIKKIQQEKDFAPRQTPLCNFCDYRPYCDVGRPSVTS